MRKTIHLVMLIMMIALAAPVGAEGPPQPEARPEQPPPQPGARPERHEDPPERPEAPPAPLPGEDAGAWVHVGWFVGTEGSSGKGWTRLTILGHPGDTAVVACGELPRSCLADGTVMPVALPATVTLAEGAPPELAITLVDARGARWEGPIEVPRGLHVTLEVLGRYRHRGYLGAVVNDTKACKYSKLRKKLRLDVLVDRAPAMPHLILEPGKSAPGLRLPRGSYTLLVSEPAGRGWREREAVPFNVDGPDWRAVAGCPTPR
jgi:hypothetical protein